MKNFILHLNLFLVVGDLIAMIILSVMTLPLSCLCPPWCLLMLRGLQRTREEADSFMKNEWKQRG